MQPNLLRADGGEDEELSQADVWQFVEEIGYSHHFTRWVALIALENEDVWPINSSTVRTRVKEMTGADTVPGRQSVLRSMERFKSLGAVERREIENGPGYHWTCTDYGQELAHQIAIEWCGALGRADVTEAIRARDDSTDSDDQ